MTDIAPDIPNSRTYEIPFDMKYYFSFLEVRFYRNFVARGKQKAGIIGKT